MRPHRQQVLRTTPRPHFVSADSGASIMARSTAAPANATFSERRVQPYTRQVP
ncbi:MAG: hypothetical protein ACK50C_16595 [Gemmatimonadaceae bacterium]